MNAQSLKCTWLCVLIFTGFILSSAGADQKPVKPLAQAHSHNDYEHERPLLDALSNGFCSVEADIWLVEGELLVAHDRDQVQPGRTLESLYLKPLRECVVENDGRVFRDGPQFTLLIDFKSEAGPTYDALQKVLEKHENILTRFEKGAIHTNAITVIVSGNRPFEKMRSEPVRLAAIDGRLSDLEDLPPAELMPLISDNWQNHFKWRGEGPMTDEEQMKLRDIVSQIHESGRRVRFWAAPDIAASWDAQKKVGVDLINTDKLSELSTFLQASDR